VIVAFNSASGGTILTIVDSNSDSPSCGSQVKEAVDSFVGLMCVMKAGTTITSVTCGVNSSQSINCLVAWYTPGPLTGVEDVSKEADNQNVTSWTSQTAISSFTGTSGTLTFTTAQNNFASGNTFTLTGFTGGNVGLNGQTVTVLSAGLTGTAFEATVTGSGYSSGAGQVTSANLTGSTDLVVGAFTTNATSSSYSGLTQRIITSGGCAAANTCALADENVSGTSPVTCAGTWIGGTPTYGVVACLAIK
jgi:hypothetical protein